MKTRREPLSHCNRTPGAWFEYPSALKKGGQVVGWVRGEGHARLLADLYELRGDPAAQTRQLLVLLERTGPRPGVTRSPRRFEVETAGDLLIPGCRHALKWDGQPVAWLNDAGLAVALAGVLNAFVHAFWRSRDRGPFTVRPVPPPPEPEVLAVTLDQVA